MPGTTRYSATFDRPYEEDDQLPAEPPLTRRSRSLSLQAPSALNGRPYTPLGDYKPASRTSRSSSTDSGRTEQIPTRTVGKAAVKAHNNPFQFVKVGTCSLYKKAEEQLKKVKEVKKPDVLKEEEEEWQSNLDSWKSRRRKMSEDVFKRQEEIRQFEMEEQVSQAPQKKTKTFSEMVESRAHRGRTLSLCLISSPLELQNWEVENSNKKHSNSIHSSGGSEENSNVNSDDECSNYKGTPDNEHMENHNGRTNGSEHNLKNGTSLQNGNYNKISELETSQESISQKESAYVDSGLESISSSHRAGDIADSGSDFSQDSGSMDSESPIASDLAINGIKLLQDYGLHASQMNGKMSHQSSQGTEIVLKLCLSGKVQEFGFTFICSADQPQVVKVASVKDGSVAKSKGIMKDDQIFSICGKEVSSMSHSEIQTLLKEATKKKFADLILIRPFKSDSKNLEKSSSLNSLQSCSKNEVVLNKNNSDKNIEEKILPSKAENLKSLQSQERSVESENEMYVDDFEELNRNSCQTSNDSTVNKLDSNGVQQTSLSRQLSEEKGVNVIFKSPSVNKVSEIQRLNSNTETNGMLPLLSSDVPPVEKVAEEMEKLILEQLEEEERAKELASEMQAKGFNPLENGFIAPSRQAEPPKVKPPPPPGTVNETKKVPSLGRVNSTKRIKKEIHKRRSNFLGIENSDDKSTCDEISIPPPPALEDLLKAEMEIDRESIRKLESAAAERFSLEETELAKKEQEIIKNLETEERQKLYFSHLEEQSDEQLNPVTEEERIQILKEERKRMEEERISNEEQRLRLEEEKQLRDREEYIKRQEDAQISAPLLSATNAKIPIATSLSPETKSSVLLSEGEGLLSVLTKASKIEDTVPTKPIVPPKPIKKKEAIRKERERLRQEQEALQREREEHRQKLLKEQEEIMKSHQKPHAFEAAVSRIGPVPHPKPPFTPQLTTSLSAPPRENVTTFTSRSHHGAQNGLPAVVSPENTHLISHPRNRQNKPVSSRGKTVQNETWGQQKVPSVKKQNHDSLTESRYNQNHWLIQEAEMRRIAELKERQRASQLYSANQPVYSQTHLAEDDACSPRMPHNSNYPMSDPLWNYQNPSQAIMKYPPVVSSDKPMLSPPTKPSRVVPLERQEQMLSVSGRKRCSHCNEELGRGAAMIIESLQLYYHIHCFQCCVCQAQLGNGSCGTDVRVRNNKLHCHNCYSNDEAGLKFSQV